MNVEEWAKFMGSTAGLDDVEKVRRTNDFFNKMPFKADQADTWSTPEQMFAAGGGDCEDYAFGKFATLRRLGIPEEQLKVSYVNMLRGEKPEPHMVLMYDDQVLDNVNQNMLHVKDRKDLSNALYQVNSTGLYRDGKPLNQKLAKWESLLPQLGVAPEPGTEYAQKLAMLLKRP